MIYLDIDRDRLTGGYQLSIGNGSHGYRIAGPKYTGNSTSILRHTLAQRDADEIREYLDREFPTTQEAKS